MKQSKEKNSWGVSATLWELLRNCSTSEGQSRSKDETSMRSWKWLVRILK